MDRPFELVMRELQPAVYECFNVIEDDNYSRIL